jgi:hypothetical protein
MFDFMRAWRGFSSFGSWCTLHNLDDAKTSPRPLCLHVDQGLQRHEHPWVPTNQGLTRPRQAGPTYQTTRRHDMRAQGCKYTWGTRQDSPAQISFPCCNQLG